MDHRNLFFAKKLFGNDSEYIVLSCHTKPTSDRYHVDKITRVAVVDDSVTKTDLELIMDIVYEFKSALVLVEDFEKFRSEHSCSECMELRVGDKMYQMPAQNLFGAPIFDLDFMDDEKLKSFLGF